MPHQRKQVINFVFLNFFLMIKEFVNSKYTKILSFFVVKKISFVRSYVIRCCVLAFLAFFLFLDQPIALAQTSPDAIAIRVMPNPNHYSASRWYKEQKFTGSPQSLSVDGYEAVRDGRTVYVNVANVSGGNLYTNIYLISYNQAAEKKTVDIFGRILDHWKFNTNIVTTGFCRTDNNVRCLIDDDCPVSDYCDSAKARVIRDTARLAGLAEISAQLKSYNDKKGKYPNLSVGTYLPQKTLSVWPSWIDTLSKELGAKTPIDPVNKIGPCPSKYNASTCWDEVQKSFVNVLPAIPHNSLIYTYLTNPAGATYDLCTVFESGLAMTGVDYVSAICPSICLDFDKDGYGNPGSAVCSSGSVLTDCNDTNGTITFGTPENFAGACGNGLDDDCDGFSDCNDIDCLGFCSVPLLTCGDPTCDAGECNTCPGDCHVADCCPNTVCDSFVGETNLTCPLDCSGSCVNAVCEAGECNSCPSDCAIVDCCGDSTCQGAVGENSVTCSADCECTDIDGDHWYLESSDCNAEPMFAGHNDCDDGNPNIFPGNPEICDNLDNNCSDTDHSVINPADVDETFINENCSWVCNKNFFNWVGILPAPLMCCGNDLLEAGPFESPEFLNCGDGRDNDCNGLTDNLPAPAGPDPSCAGTCSGASAGENFYYVASEDPDCNQCDFEGDNDSDQIPSAFGLNWTLNFPGMADMCDPDCVPFGATINPASPAVHIDKYEATETRCDDLDNDCDNTIDEGCDEDGDDYCDNTMHLYDNNSACPNTPYSGPADDGKVGNDCLDTNSAVFEGAAEVCGDGLDNDCLGGDAPCAALCTDSDGDSFDDCSVGQAGDDGKVIDCNDSEFWVNPGGSETCDLLDNDCSGTPDEVCDNDSDGYCDAGRQIYNSNAMCPNTSYAGAIDNGKWGNDCDDDLPTIFPTNPEICDGHDNNCSDNNHGDGINVGDIDEGLDPDVCQYTCDTVNAFNWTGTGGALNCCGDDILTEAGPFESPESLNCSDGRDNDCNGLIDPLDPSCNTCCKFNFTFSCTFCP
jgi:hypothetical protein